MPDNKILHKVHLSYRRRKYIVNFDEDGVIRVIERALWNKGHWLERWVETQRYSTKRASVRHKSKYNRIIELAQKKLESTKSVTVGECHVHSNREA